MKKMKFVIKIIASGTSTEWEWGWGSGGGWLCGLGDICCDACNLAGQQNFIL